MKRVLTAFCAFAILLASMPLAAWAQADSGQIIISIQDSSAAKAPVPMARVLLDGPVITSEYSGANGAVKFTEVPDGIYRARVFKRGYQAVTSEQFEVSNGRAVTVSVVLAKAEQLKEIGSITVKSSATVSTSSVGDSTAQRKLSDTLADALNKISGVSVTTNGSDSDATQTVSLEGHDASQTALTLDGIPLNAPGSAGNLGAIGSDLFRGASVSFGPQTGGLGGGVNFRTLEPTLAWQGNASISGGSYGKYNWSFAQTGSLGKLGIALQHTSRTTPSLANGLRYLDASGLNYEHDAQNSSAGDLVKLRYRLGGSQTLSATYLSNNGHNDLICLQITGALPCGYGPNNSTSSHFTLMSLSDSALIGETAVQTSIFQNSVKADRDLLSRFLNGIPDPTGSLTDSTTRGFSINAVLPAKERHTFSISANSMSTSSTTTALVASAIPFTERNTSSSYSSISINDAIQSSTKLKLNDHVGLSHASNVPTSILAGVSAAWTPTTNDTYTASYDIGGSAAQPGRFGFLSDPTSLRFDCNGNVAYGNAPGDDPTATSSTSARLGWTHKLKNGTINASLYRQVQNGTLLPAQVNGSVLSGIPAGYFNAVQNVYDSPGGCNAGAGVPFGAQNVYFSVPIGGIKRVYQGAQLAANVSLGNLNVQPFYNITVATANSNDPRINNPFSIITSGAQLPGTPLHRAGLTLDYKAPRSVFEELVSLQYTGSNNNQNLPANTVVDAGINAHLTHGDITFAANNIFNSFGGIFATNVGAVPYMTQGGQQIATIARPNSPRQYSVTYTVPFGLGARTAARPTLASQVGENEGVGPGGGPGGRGRFGINLTPLPATPPADPFALATSNTACTADAQKQLQPMMTELKAYVAKVEASKTAAGYPNTAPDGLPQVPGMTIGYHKVGTSYALTTDVQRVSTANSMQGLLACMPLHIAQPEDVASRGLYAPPSSMFARPSMTFMPAVGFYFARPAPQAGQATFRLYKLPTTAPATPFAMHASDTCTAEVKPIAQRLLDELAAYFKSGTALKTWKVTPHTATGGTWYELNNDDISTIPALLNCGRVAIASSDELKAVGMDGARPPAISYSPKLGLYLMRNRPPGQGPGNGGPPGRPPGNP